MVGVERERLLSEQIDAKLDECVAHRQQLIVLHRIIAFGGLQLTRLVTDYPFCSFTVILYESTPNGKITRVANHVGLFRVIR